MFDWFEATIAMLNYTLDTPKSRHIVGGMLLSISLMFGGFALTAMTIKQDDGTVKEETHNHEFDY